MARILHAIEKKEKKEIFIHTNAGAARVPEENVYYPETRGHYVIYHTAQGEIGHWSSLAAAEKMLDEKTFFRCDSRYGIRRGSRVAPEFLKTDYADEIRMKAVQQIKKSNLQKLFATAGYAAIAIEGIGKPATKDSDGPGGLDSFVCGVSGRYTPGMDTHRSVFGGRNSEYYSEDGFPAGKIAAATVKGCQSKGVYLYIKHFALNEQDTNRGSSLHTQASGQAMRESISGRSALPCRKAKRAAIVVTDAIFFVKRKRRV